MLRFGEALRNLTAEDFAQLLVRELAPAVVVVGHDFRFGKNGAATAAVLAAAGERLGFAVDVLPAVTLDGERISSSGVRMALAAGDFARARPLRSAGRGRCAGVCTAASVSGGTSGSPRPICRSSGAVRRWAGSSRCACTASTAPRAGGVASLGTRPTVAGTVPLLEAHVFDFSGELYGREIEVEFVAKLREEQRFATLAALTAQMRCDAAAARQILLEADMKLR